MSTSDFRKSPWLNSHPAFDGSAFNIRPAPEFSTGEVVMASLYRSSGFAGVSEKGVPAAGKEFDKAAHRERRHEAEAGRIQPDTWRTVLDRVIQSPKVAQQSSKRFLSISPIVPDAALYSGSARLTGNAWNPGQLVQRIIQMGAPTEQVAQSIWMQLHEALTVQTDDDVWARWLQSEFEPRRSAGREWRPTELAAFDGLPHHERAEFAYPAQQFVIDLQGIISAKPAMTRRQWVSLLEAVLRIGTVSHVLWLCRVNDKLWRAIGGLLGHGDEAIPSGRDEVVSRILAGKRRLLSFGNPAIPTMRDYASKYLSARLGLNAVLWALDDIGSPVANLKSAGDLWGLIKTVGANADALRRSGVLESFNPCTSHSIP